MAYGVAYMMKMGRNVLQRIIYRHNMSVNKDHIKITVTSGTSEAQYEVVAHDFCTGLYICLKLVLARVPTHHVSLMMLYMSCNNPFFSLFQKSNANMKKKNTASA